MIDCEREITALIRECGKIMLSVHSVENEKGAIETKSGAANFVTRYDKAVQTKLIDGIKRLFPDAMFFAEEKDNSFEPASARLLFVIDPIDGTTNFIHDMKCSVISVGAFSYSKPLFGIIYNPYFDELFFAENGNGAFLNGNKISVSDRELSEALVSFGTAPYYREKYADRVFDSAKRVFMKCADIRRSGSAAYDICCVACGRTDAYFEEQLSPWDFAAGSIIISEAGGRCTDMTGKELRFCSPSSFLCTNSLIYKKITDTIKE